MGTLKLIQYPSQLLSLTISDIINKQNLSQLIQKSKKDDSENWEGKDWIIKNTPQQGINWIGEHPNIKAVIIKTKDGSYADDGWKNNEKPYTLTHLKQQKASLTLMILRTGF